MRLDPLFRPESIALIGASDKPTPGRRIIASLEHIGFAGRIFPVNPNYPSVLNRPCYASPAELPEAPDIAVFCLGHERVLSALGWGGPVDKEPSRRQARHESRGDLRWRPCR